MLKIKEELGVEIESPVCVTVILQTFCIPFGIEEDCGCGDPVVLVSCLLVQLLDELSLVYYEVMASEKAKDVVSRSLSSLQ